MFQIDEDMTIYITRGDVAYFSVTADNNGVPYKFKPGDVVRIKVYAKKDATNVAFQKDFPVLEESEKVDILLTEAETKIGDVISKPVDYWYEIELNPYSNPQTIVGYDDDGAKIFKLFPEGRDLGPDTVPEDVPVVDAELSLTSQKPVENQAVTRAIVKLSDEVKNEVGSHAEALAKVEAEVEEAVNKTYAETDRVSREIAVERSRITNLATLSEGSTTGDAELIDARVGADGVTYASAGESVRTQIAGVKSDLNQLHDELGDVVNTVQSENLFDKDNANNLYDKYVTYNGGMSDASGYFTSALIYLEVGTYTYRTWGSGYSDKEKVPTYTEDGTFLAFITGTISDVDYVTFTVTEPTYIRLKSANSVVDVLMLVKGSEYPTEYIPYYYRKVLGEDIDTTEKVVETLNSLNISNPLYGKKISANGDSICYGNGYLGGYAKLIAERNDMQYENIAVGGGTITAETYSGSTARHWITRTIGNMSDDADYIIIEGGVNDVANEVSIGSFTSGFNDTLDDTTFYGALETIFKELNMRYMGKKFGFVIVHQMIAGMQEGGAYYSAVIECARKWGVPVLDLSKEVPPFNWFRGNEAYDSIRNEYTTNGDGWHPTEKCYREYYVPKIEAWLKSL